MPIRRRTRSCGPQRSSRSTRTPSRRTSQNWNLERPALAVGDKYLVEVRYVGAKGTHLPRNIEANPAVYGPGATAQNADRRRIYANCPPDGGTCDFSTIAMLPNITNSTYQAGQASVSRRFRGLGFNVSYWYSKSLDYLSAMNLSGAAAKPLAGENDLAQNPFNLDAEHGPSLFDARHRFVASGSWEPHVPDSCAACGPGDLRRVAAERDCRPQFRHAIHRVGFDQRLAAGQQSADFWLRGKPAGPDRRSQCRAAHRRRSGSAASAFHRLNPLTQAGQFGNAGRNIARGPAYTNVDVSLVRELRLRRRRRACSSAPSLQRREPCQFGLPVADLNSANFGRILSAASPRLMQFALKLIF